MPSAESLPAALTDLARHNAIEIRDSRWKDDLDRLIERAARILSESQMKSSEIVQALSDPGLHQDALSEESIVSKIPRSLTALIDQTPDEPRRALWDMRDLLKWYMKSVKV